MDYNKLSKIISHALRHEPHTYGLSLSDGGWVNLNDLIKGITRCCEEFNSITVDDIKIAVTKSSKKRHEIIGDKIRAYYGHSIDIDLKLGKSSEPPIYLYHGTSLDVVNKIKSEGLQKMERQFVHLTEKIEDALSVAKRKSEHIVILRIKAKEAFRNGVEFHVQSAVWLCTFIPKEFIDFD